MSSSDNLNIDTESIHKAQQKIRDAMPSAEDAAKALRELSEAASQVVIPPLREIARMRRRRLWEQYGMICLFIPEWWRWLKLEKAPNA